MPRNTTIPRRVDFALNKWDRPVWKMARAGLSVSHIAATAKLTPFQVIYRLSKKKASIRIRDYREGKTTEVALVLDAIDGLVTQEISDYAKQQEREERRNRKGGR